MSTLLLSGVQIALSMWEIWLCYQLLYFTVFEEQYDTRADRIVMWCTIVLPGGALGLNRLVSFFSYLMFFFISIVVIVCVWSRKRKKLLSVGIIFLYFTIVAILDMAFALISIEFLGETFRNKVYVYAMTWQKECIFLLSRSIICVGILYLKKRGDNVYEIVEKCKGTVLGIGCVLCVLLIKYQYILNDMTNGKEAGKGISASFILLTITILTVLVEIFMLRDQYTKQEKEGLLLREQLLEERYMEMLKSRKLLHDMKNHLLLLRKYEEGKQWEELHSYLKEISDDILEDTTKVWSGNVVVDLMLNTKKAYAEAQGTNVEIDTEVMTNFPLGNRETISLFGNLLDNAIEACERMTKGEKWVRIKMRKHHELLSIEVENSIEEIPKERNGSLISNKMERGGHGYGMSNIRHIVDKYDGTYSYQISENTFLTSVAFFDNEDVI